MTTVNGEDDVPVCFDACSDTWEEEFFNDIGQEDQSKEQDEEAILSLEDIQLFLESRGRLQDAMQVGNFMDNLSAVQIATANRPLFMISFNSNSSLFRVSFNFVNTCYFFVICSFSPKNRTSEMGPTSQQGPNIPSPMRSLLGGFNVLCKTRNLAETNFTKRAGKGGVMNWTSAYIQAVATLSSRYANFTNSTEGPTTWNAISGMTRTLRDHWSLSIPTSTN